MGWQLHPHKMEVPGERELTIQHVVQAVICALQRETLKTLCNAPHERWALSYKSVASFSRIPSAPYLSSKHSHVIEVVLDIVCTEVVPGL